MNPDYTIKENSFIARMAARKLRSERVAIVIGKVIHLHHIRGTDFINNERWLKHELCHIDQFKRYGFLSFIVKYTWESIKHGYRNNKYEIEARNAEDSQ